MTSLLQIRMRKGVTGRLVATNLPTYFTLVEEILFLPREIGRLRQTWSAAAVVVNSPDFPKLVVSMVRRPYVVIALEILLRGLAILVNEKL